MLKIEIETKILKLRETFRRRYLCAFMYKFKLAGRLQELSRKNFLRCQSRFGIPPCAHI